jgi:Tetratricopeptide repeat
MKLVAWFVAALCTASVLVCKWVAFTLSNRISGLNLSVLADVPRGSATPWISYGYLAAVLFILAAWTFSRKHWNAFGWTGVALLSIGLLALLQLAFVHCGLLKEVVDEEVQARTAAQFTTKHLPLNAGNEPSNEPSDMTTYSSIQTLTDRIVAARYHMGFAWYVAVFGGLFALFFGAQRVLSAQERFRMFAGSLAIAALLATVCCAGPVVARFALVSGEKAESNGDPSGAIGQYRKAIRLDKWLALHTDVYARIGLIDARFGRNDTVEHGIYRAELMVAKHNFPSAIAEFERLTSSAACFPQLLRIRTAEVWTDYGLQLYREGAIGSAASAWQNALAQDPAQWLAGLCLSRAYFQTGRYQESADLIEGLIKRLSDPQLRANLQSNLGDAYTRLGDLQKARRAYRFSYTLDDILNWRALTALVGGSGE